MWRSNTARCSQMSARVFCGPPPCTTATATRASGSTAPPAETTSVPGATDPMRPDATSTAAPTSAGLRLHDSSAARVTPATAVNAVSSSGPPTRTTGAKRARHLPHGHGRQRHTAERPAPSQELRQHEDGRERGPATMVGRHQNAGRGVHSRESRYRQGPANQSQIEHPHRRRGEPADADQSRQRSPAVGLGLGQQLHPQGQADESQRPEAPWRQGPGH